MLRVYWQALIIVLGPTATGKTSQAIKIAQFFHTEIVSADSRQFYRELKIGSAMPSEEELQSVTHHLIGHLSIQQVYNVSRYEQDALSCIEKLFQKHDHVVLCGGSMLYIDAVYKGMDTLPDPDPDLRNNIKKRLEEEGLQALQFELKRLDPEYFHTSDIKNPSRLIRALEVCIISGKPYSEQRKNIPRHRSFQSIFIGLQLPIHQLTERIRYRTTEMIRKGLLEEARSLLAFRELNALNTVGYKEMFSCLDGNINMEEATEKICINTRRYAKRQMTWFRRNPDIQWFLPSSTEDILHYIRQQG